MKQVFSGIFTVSLALAAAAPAFAAEKANTEAARGFYGGVMVREAGTDGAGINFGPATSVWARFAASTIDDSSSRSLVFGGYRWQNDIAVEAAFNSSDKYALRSPVSGRARGGVGLSFANTGASLADLHSRTWNMDVYTSWAFYKNLALYGRLGYAQAEAVPLFNNSLSTSADARRLRDGVNYGVGLRYDMNPALGLRLEYARFGRFAGDGINLNTSTLPESDQVTFGIQFRF